MDRFGRLTYGRNGASDVKRPDRHLGLGARFLDLSDGISEEKILAALPRDNICEDIRLIEIDGAIKGAALVFKPKDSRHGAPAVSRPIVKPLPGVDIGKTGLKIVGASNIVLETLDAANRIASANAPTLIDGQTGVGKELFARLIHSRMDPDGAHRFRPINCGAMVPQMFGADLLQGTKAPICLDEIGETTPDVQDALMAHSWPGNVRELRNLMSGRHCLAKSRTVALADLPSEVTTLPVPKAGQTEPGGLQDQHAVSGSSLKEAEVTLIGRALQWNHGNLSKTAIALGISRPTLYRKIETYGISLP